MLVKIGRAVHAQLRYHTPVGTRHAPVILADHVEHHRVIRLVALMIVTVPVGSPHVNLHVARPHLSVDGQFGIKEVGTRVGVEPSGVDHADALPVDGSHVGYRPEAMLPDILHQSFHCEARVIVQT